MMQQRSQWSQEAVPGWARPAEVRVMRNPAAAYRLLVREPLAGGICLALKRPLLVAFVLGCTMSLLTARKSDLAIGGSGHDLLELCAASRDRGAGGSVLGRAPHPFVFQGDRFIFHGPRPLVALVDRPLRHLVLFLAGQGVFAHPRSRLFGAAAMVIVWSAYIDFCFFRFVLGRSRAGASRDLLLHRSISWSLIIAIFGGLRFGRKLQRGSGDENRACYRCIPFANGDRRWHDFRRAAPSSAPGLARLSCAGSRFSRP
jgi:hypothetical protein